MADFEQLWREHYGAIYKFLVSLCRDPGAAEELTQETFFRAYINMGRLRHDAAAVVWLYRIARNAYYAWYKERKKLLPLDTQPDAAVPDVAEAAENKALSSQAMQILSGMEEPYRAVFSLHIFGEVPLKEISRLYGKSESWARVTFYRAKQKIMERMG